MSSSNCRENYFAQNYDIKKFEIIFFRYSQTKIYIIKKSKDVVEIFLFSIGSEEIFHG
jgi:hypothetical protein